MFRPNVKLVQEPSAGARIVDEARQRTLTVTPIEGKLLALLAPGMTLEVLPAAAKAAGVDLEAPQIEAVLTRLHASGFIELIGPAKAPEKALAPDEIVPAFRSDLEVTSGGGSTRVTDPQRDRSFTLYEFEVHLARLLDGRHTVRQVLDAASKLSVPVGAEGLARFIGQMRAYGFLDGPAATPTVDSSTWGTRSQWSPAVRELYQSALRSFRQGRKEVALEYVQSLLELQPDTPEAAALKRQIEADTGEDLSTDDSMPELVAASEPLMSSGEMPAVKLPPSSVPDAKPWATVKPWSRTPLPVPPKPVAAEPKWEPKPLAPTPSAPPPSSVPDAKPWATVKPWSHTPMPVPPKPSTPAPEPVASAPAPSPSPSPVPPPAPSGPASEPKPWATLTPRFSPPMPPAPRFSPPMPPAPKSSPPMPPPPAATVEVKPSPRSSPPMPMPPPPALAPEPTTTPAAAPLPPPPAAMPEPKPSPVVPPAPAAPAPEPLPPPVAAPPPPPPAAPARPSRPIFGRPFIPSPPVSEPRPADAERKTALETAFVPSGPSLDGRSPKPSAPIYGKPLRPALEEPAAAPLSFEPTPRTSPEVAPVKEPATIVGPAPAAREPSPATTLTDDDEVAPLMLEPLPETDAVEELPPMKTEPRPANPPVDEAPPPVKTEPRPANPPVDEAPPPVKTELRPTDETPAPRKSRPPSPLTEPALPPQRSIHDTQPPPPRRSRPSPAVTEAALPPVLVEAAPRPMDTLDTEEPYPEAPPTDALKNRRTRTKPPLDSSTEPVPAPPPEPRRTLSKPVVETVTDPVPAPPSVEVAAEPVTTPPPRTQSKPTTAAVTDAPVAEGPVPEAAPIVRRSSQRVPKQEEPPPKRAGLYIGVAAVLLLAALAFPIPAVQRIDVELVTTPKATPKMPGGVFGELKVQSGARVDEGAIIATLDMSKQKTQKEELTAQVARLDAAAAKALAKANPAVLAKAKQAVVKAKQDVAKARAQLPRAKDRAKAEVDLAKKEAVVESAERAVESVDSLQKAKALKLEATAGREKLAALQVQLDRAAVTAPASGVFELDQLPPAGAQFDDGTPFGRIVEKELLVKGAPADGKDPVLVLGERRVGLFSVDQRPEGLTVPFENGMTPGRAVLEVSKGYRPWPMVVFAR